MHRWYQMSEQWTLWKSWCFNKQGLWKTWAWSEQGWEWSACSSCCCTPQPTDWTPWSFGFIWYYLSVVYKLCLTKGLSTSWLFLLLWHVFLDLWSLRVLYPPIPSSLSPQFIEIDLEEDDGVHLHCDRVLEKIWTMNINQLFNKIKAESLPFINCNEVNLIAQINTLVIISCSSMS